MKLTNRPLPVVLWFGLALLLSACGGGSSDPSAGGQIPIVQLNGTAQKGPLILGSTVTIQELDDTLTPTGRSFSTQTNDDLGHFTISAPLATSHVEASVTGYYFDEIVDSLSAGTITLRSLSEVSGSDSIKINLLTHLAANRIAWLVGDGMSFQAAKDQAKGEILAILGITSSTADFDRMDISQAGDSNAVLLAASAILLHVATERSAGTPTVSAELSNLLSQIGKDLEQDGVLDNQAISNEIGFSSRWLDLAAVRSNIESRYADLGQTVTAPPFEDFVDSDGDGAINRGDPSTFGEFHATGDMILARYYHTATRLLDGKVLIVGGLQDGDPFDGNEIYDPESGNFSLVGDSLTSRGLHTATLLENGQVLIVGGGGSISVDSSELYDPNSGLFTSTGSMVSARRRGHTATLLPDGSVLIVGGAVGDQTDIAPEEIYDPDTGTFAATGMMVTVRRFGHTATLLPDGTVLIVGGRASTGILATAEIFDPSSGSFMETGSMTVARADHTATLLLDGRVLVVGGQSDSGRPAVAETYDPDAGLFRTVDSLPSGRDHHTATLLANGKVLVTGIGERSDVLFDPSTDTFAFAGDTSISDGAHTATLLNDGSVLIAGGWGDTGGFGPQIPNAQLYVTQ